MTNEEIILLKQDGIQKEIFDHRNDDPGEYALTFYANPSLPVRAIAEQINCYRKARVKLPDLYQKQLLYQSDSLQQSTPSILANLKPDILNIGGKRLIDLTGGLGIDTIFLSGHFEQTIYCEQDSILAELAGYNFKKLGRNNIQIHNGDSISFLYDSQDHSFDWLYIDPSRRDENGRHIAMEDCFPNVVEYLELFLQKSDNICIKLSPALEITEISRKLRHLKSISVFSLDGECKEVTCTLCTGIPADNIPVIQAVVIKTGDEFPLILKQYSPKPKRSITSGLKKYFYEPDAAVIKSRLTYLLTSDSDLAFFNHQTDYLTSDSYLKDFPGRLFQIVDYFPFKSGNVTDYLNKENIVYANIARRDFPMSPDQIKKRFHLKDGGEHYLFFTKDAKKNKLFIHCIKP